MRIGELAKRAGLSRDTIRLYESRGLIRSDDGPAPTNTYRDYPDETLDLLSIIGDAQAAGMTLADVSILLAQMEAVPTEDFDGLAFLDDKIADVQARLDRATTFLETLKATRAALARAPYD